MESTEVLVELPPSATLVLRILRDLKISNLNRLREESGLSRRGLMYALKTLTEMDLIEAKICLTDTRRRFYCIKLK